MINFKRRRSYHKYEFVDLVMLLIGCGFKSY